MVDLRRPRLSGTPRCVLRVGICLVLAHCAEPVSTHGAGGEEDRIRDRHLAQDPVLPLVNDFVGTPGEDLVWEAPAGPAERVALLDQAYRQELARRGIHLDDSSHPILHRLARARYVEWNLDFAEERLQHMEQALDQESLGEAGEAGQYARARLVNLETYLSAREGGEKVRKKLATLDERLESLDARLQRLAWTRGLKNLLFYVFAPLLGSLVLAWVVYRFWRAGQARRMESYLLNPYVAGAPIRDAQAFFGREHVVHRALRLLDEGRAVYLSGERRIGKTTLVLQVQHAWQAAGGASVFVSLEGLPSGGSLAALREAIRNLAEETGATVDRTASIRSMLLRVAQKRRILVCLDEVDFINAGSPGERAVVRKLMEDPPERCRLLMAGVDLDTGSLIEDHRRDRLVEIPVRPLPETEARRLLLTPAEGIVRFSPTVTDTVIRRSRGRPMHVQLYGLRLVDHFGSKDHHPIWPWRIPMVTQEDLEAVEDSVESAWESVCSTTVVEKGGPLDLDLAWYELARLEDEVQELRERLAEAP